MRVELRPSTFSDDVELRDVLNLIHCFTSGRHDWVALDPSVIDIAEDYLQQYLPKAAASCAELAQKGTVAATWAAGSIAVPSISVEESNLADSVHDLCRPAIFVVENENSDPVFVEAVCRAFDDKRILDALEHGWMEYAHGGGSTIESVARSEARRFRAHVRVAALLDSDSQHRTHRTENHVKGARLAELGVAVHVLTLREVENYIPNKVLAATGNRGKWSESSKRMTSLKALPLERRGYFDMKRGYVESDPSKPQQAQQAWAADLDTKILKDLCGGFGGNVLLELRKFPNLSIRDFESTGEDVRVEIRQFLTTINSVI